MEQLPSVEGLAEDTRRVLENPFWLSSLTTTEIYQRVEDDDDGTGKGILAVQFTPDGDAIIGVGYNKTARFRTFAGGGKSLRVRNALMILAEAIRLDNEERPQQ